NNTASTRFDLGLGGSSSSSCDTNGTLLSGLVGYWKFDDQPQGSTVTDLSGHGNNGTFAGSNGFLPLWQNSASCLTGSCLSFPASGDAPQPPRYRSYVAIPTNSTSSLNLGTSDFTISGWVKAQPPAATGYTPPPTKTGAPGTGIFGKFQHDTSNFRGNFIIGFGDWSPNYLFFTHLNSNGISFSSQPYDYSPYWNQWTLITWVKSGNNLLLYLNGGAAKATFPITTPFDISFSSSGPYYIPDGNWSPGIWNNLSIDDHRIYNWALSSQDITALYNNGNGCVP
ncbi:LamG domain-containing protein, partial [Patescibacteria group bacterium]|nr:LamG domain-containing protein [Patescibacteria group bacterium]